ncbi:MAG: nitroreductase family protein [Candidatus Hodarchaeales archaeon]
MEFLSLIEKRRSIRKFTEKEISKDLEKKIVTNVLLAPSAGNLQSFGIISVRDDDVKNKIFEAALQQDPIIQASLVLVFFTDEEQSAQRYRDRGRKLYSLQDATIATTYAHLICADLGLSSVWIGAFKTEQVQKILNLPSSKVPIAILPIGYADEDPEPRSRRKYKEMVKSL